jgi:hypothetical protein
MKAIMSAASGNVLSLQLLWWGGGRYVEFPRFFPLKLYIAPQKIFLSVLSLILSTFWMLIS